jgi:hypothetical protein
VKITKTQLKQIVEEEFKNTLKEAGGDPLAVSVLGAPAAGKTYTRNLIGKIAKRFQQAADTGENLTVDVIRDEFLKNPANKRLPEFYKAFFTLKDFSEKNPQFAKWFDDIKDLWNGKLSQLVQKFTGGKFSADERGILLNGERASLEDFMGAIQGKEEDIAAGLHPYKDQKRVVRHLQLAQSKKASGQKKDVMYDETGDEPSKMVTRLDRLHNMGYVTDAILVHPASVVVNLLQNASRMINGSDGGRDSSSSIVGAYNDIDKGKKLYDDSAEVSLATTSGELSSDKDVQKALAQANVSDDAKRGDKPIDVFVQVDSQSVADTYERIAKDFSPEAQSVLKAILMVQVSDSGLGVTDETKQEVAKMKGLPSIQQAKQIIDAVKKSSNPKEEYGQPMTGVLDMSLQEGILNCPSFDEQDQLIFENWRRLLK